MALSLKKAARMLEDGALNKRLEKRYAGWNGELGQQIMQGRLSLAQLAQYAEQNNLNPQHQVGIRNYSKTLSQPISSTKSCLNAPAGAFA